MKYIIYSTSWGNDPVFYGTSKTIWEAEEIISELVDAGYDRYLDRAVTNAEMCLRDLLNYEECDYAPHDYVVFSKLHGEVFYDTYDDILADANYYVYGEYIADYINKMIPDYKIGKTV